MLSPLGRRLYFPKGILTQGAEAKQKGHRFNATIGIATENGARDVPALDARATLAASRPTTPYNYAPRRGQAERCASAGARSMLAENPSAARQGVRPADRDERDHARARARRRSVRRPGRRRSCCPTSSGATTGSPTRCGSARASSTFPFYAGDGFDTRRASARRSRKAGGGREQADRAAQLPEQPDRLHADARRRATRSPTRSIAQAERGTKRGRALRRRVLRALLSPRRRVDDRVAVRPTREPRTRTCSRSSSTARPRSCSSGACAAASSRSARAAPTSAPEVLRRARGQGEGRDPRRGLEQPAALADARREGARVAPSIDAERKREGRAPARARRRRSTRSRARRASARAGEVYPFNSGYFMCVKVKGVDAEKLRVHLLDKHGIGPDLDRRRPTSASRSRASRSSEVEPLFETLHRAIQELRSA